MLELIGNAQVPKHMAPSNTAVTLNELIRTCRDGEAICRIWSHAAAGPDLRDLLRERSHDWARQADELQALVLLFSGSATSRGTAGGWLLANWVIIKTALLGRGDLPVIVDWEQVQRRALRRYQLALRESLPPLVRRTLTLQASRLSAHHHRLEDLRGHFAAHSH